MILFCGNNVGRMTNAFQVFPTFYRNIHSQNSIHKNSCRVVRYASNQVDSSDGGDKWLKRKVAMVIGYVGTSYHGLQMAKNNDVSTIEQQLEQALHKAGCISDSNHGQLTKIGWSRSSRTDKGVHAARVVVSAKLLLNPQWDIDNKVLSNLKDSINQLLPSDVRVFSCIRVNNGFRAREACHWREYEYFLPVETFLSSFTYQNNKLNQSDEYNITYLESNKSIEEYVSRLNTVFALLQGSKSMHNFHRSKEINKKKLNNKRNEDVCSNSNVSSMSVSSSSSSISINDGDEEKQCDVDLDIDEIEECDEGVDDEEVPQANITSQYIQSRMQYLHENWTPIERPVASGTVYKMHGSLVTKKLTNSHDDVNNTQMIKVTIRGQAFLLHQIRLMISAAVLYARGIVPLSAIHAALELPYHIGFPLAPSVGLVLVNSGFSRNVNSQDYCLTKSIAQPSDIMFMTEQEEKECNDFEMKHIHNQILKDWRKDDFSILTKWFDMQEQYRVPVIVNDKWNKLLEDNRAALQSEEKMRKERENIRILASIAKYEEFIKAKKGSVPSSTNSSNTKRLIPKVDRKMPHRMFLPNSFATELMIRFDAIPGCVALNEALQAITTKICRREISSSLYANALADLVISKGNIDYWRNQPKCPWIE